MNSLMMQTLIGKIFQQAPLTLMTQKILNLGSSLKLSFIKLVMTNLMESL